MYVCGPTVYDIAHLGHARSAVCFDLIRRYFLYRGFRVTFVSNITDVDDKMIKRAAEEKITEGALALKIIPEYEKDYAALNILPPDHQPRATAYIPQMVSFVEQLMNKGAAYATEDGVYFEVAKFHDYGKLSRQKLGALQSGARIAVDEKKKNPLDFALWKRARPGEPQWKGPVGMTGRPGWHIECSAMSMHLLGETFDIHGGGIDLQFPHHEDEIAQSEMASGKSFARYWLHNGHIQVNQEKMSKSLGNFFTIKEILAKYHPSVVRYFLLSSHYRMPIEFSDNLLEQAQHGLERLQDFFRSMERSMQKFLPEPPPASVATLIQEAQEKFEEALEDDFEISRALSVIFDFVNRINNLQYSDGIGTQGAEAILKFLRKIDAVLGVLESEKEKLSSEIEKLILEREAARKCKDFHRADDIRIKLEKKNILLEDTDGKTVWKRKL